MARPCAGALRAMPRAGGDSQPRRPHRARRCATGARRAARRARPAAAGERRRPGRARQRAAHHRRGEDGAGRYRRRRRGLPPGAEDRPGARPRCARAARPEAGRFGRAEAAPAAARLAHGRQPTGGNTMKPTSGKPLAVCALALLVALAPAPGWSQAASPPAPQEEEKFESKIVWGILIQFAISKISSFAFSSAAETFVKWVTPKLTGGTEGSSDPVQANLFRDSGAKI